MTADVEQQLVLAANAIRQSDAILIGAGAGMGVDSGLPDFRGDKGFWTAYPPFKGKRFAEISNPVWFNRDPKLAWGFFGHRLNLYRETQPHQGFQILRRFIDSKSLGGFVFTSNVDGHFQRAGFDEQQVLECHGSLSHLQCTTPCSRQLWSSDEVVMNVDMDTIHATSDLPRCENCDKLARPNVLMFGDYNWVDRRCELQQQRYEAWLNSVRGGRLVVIEIGAGTGVPTVRYECERRLGTLIRINPRDTSVPSDGISIPLGGLDALQGIEALL
jgi:NAD-dependent SIR2 family protein deacetylase